jgi:hypothetical protein
VKTEVLSIKDKRPIYAVSLRYLYLVAAKVEGVAGSTEVVVTEA